MPFNSYSIHPFTLSLILSVVAGGVFYAGAWWIVDSLILAAIR
jgi:hypothetical protein